MRSLILSAGRSCFVACPGCYNHFAKSVADSTTVLRFLEQLRTRFGLRKVTVGGGDPLTRPDIVDLLRGIKGLGLRIYLDTVGTAFLRDAEIRFMGRGVASKVPAADVAAVVDLIGLPLDGSTDEILARFRRHASIVDQSEILSLMDELDASVGINTVVHAGNVCDTARMAELVAAHSSIREWQLFQYMPIGPLGHRNRQQFQISDSAFHDAIAMIDADRLPQVKVVPKAVADRKHSYLLVDSAGVLWVPDQSQAAAWSAEDENGRRSTLGGIDSPDIYDNIASLDRADTLRGA